MKALRHHLEEGHGALGALVDHSVAMTTEDLQRRQSETKTQAVVAFLQEFRENGFVASRTDAREIADKAGLELTLLTKGGEKKGRV